MRLTDTEEAASAEVVVDVKSVLTKTVDADRIQLLDRRKTNLAIPTSDFKFYVSVQESSKQAIVKGQDNQDLSSADNVADTRTEQQDVERPGSRKSKTQFLQEVSNNLENDGGFVRVRRNDKCVAAVHTLTRSKISIHPNARDSKSDPSEKIKTWTLELPSLRYLFLTLKTFLDAHDLTSGAKGGITSYALIVMIVTALKIDGVAFEPWDIGGQFLHVLKFWGTADLAQHAYSADPPKIHNKKNASHERLQNPEAQESLQSQGMDFIREETPVNPCLLCLQDPNHYRKDLGRHASAIKQVQTLFNAAHKDLSHAQRTPGKSILANIIKSNFVYFETARNQLLCSVYPQYAIEYRVNGDSFLGQRQLHRAKNHLESQNQKNQKNQGYLDDHDDTWQIDPLDPSAPTSAEAELRRASAKERLAVPFHLRAQARELKRASAPIMAESPDDHSTYQEDPLDSTRKKAFIPFYLRAQDKPKHRTFDTSSSIYRPAIRSPHPSRNSPHRVKRYDKPGASLENGHRS